MPAITDLTSLKSALSDWLVGHALDGQLDAFVAMAEAEINRKLRTRHQIKRATATLTGEYAPLPGDFLEARNVTLSTSPGTALQPISNAEADFQRQALKGGPARFFSITGAQMNFVPAPTGSPVVEMVYYAAVPPLARDGTNWLLLRAPDLLLNAALKHAAPYVNDVQRGAFWSAEAQRIIDELNAEADAADYGASPLVMRPRRAF